MKKTSSPRTTRVKLLATVLLLCSTAPARGGGPEGTYAVQVDSGWNLLSLPAHVGTGAVGDLFPSAISPAFAYHDPPGYEQDDTLQSGAGYWLKFSSTQTVYIAGELIFTDTVEVHAGWNLIGCLSVPMVVDSITTVPPGMIASRFFGYRPEAGYEESDTLAPGCGYWVKVNHGGLMIFSSGSGLPCPGIPIVDYSGRTYTTVLIGSQCWLKENLDVGTMVPGTQGQSDNDTIEKYCYDNNPGNCVTHGGLYQWNEAMQYDTLQGVQGFCPPGWHVPTLMEFQTLSATVGGDANALKAIGQGTGGGSGTNSSGFSVLLAGYRHSSGSFAHLGDNAHFWSSTQSDATLADLLGVEYFSTTIYLHGYFKDHGFSVRCLKDTSNLHPDTPSNPTPPDGSAGQSPSVMLGWSCSDPDGDSLTYDVYFGTVNPPDSMISSDQAGATFGMSGLSGATTYYWKLVARDTHTDTTSGPVWSFTTGAIGGSPCPGTPTVTYAGNIYNTVLIGTQCWLRENLDVGTMVEGSQDQTNNSVIEKYCWDNNPANCAAYGGLYQWNEAMHYDTTRRGRGICPPGWHIPTSAEFQTVTSAVGEDANALKAIGQGGYGGAGTNTSGFSALLGGSRDGPGFGGLGYSAYLWSSSQATTGRALLLYFWYDWSFVYMLSSDEIYGFGIRCLKDTPNRPPNAPADPTPSDGSGGQSPSLVLGWSCSDADEDPLTYDVYFGSVDPPETTIASGQTSTTLGMSGLSGTTTYYWKVVARDTHADTTSSPVWRFTTGAVGGSPCPGTPAVTYAGKTYNTVAIGTQCWLRENLDVGTILSAQQNQTDNDTLEMYCYDNDPANCAAYGGLFQWNEAMQYDTLQGGQGICPPGWHLPTVADLDTLILSIGSNGNALKAVGQGSGDGAGTNASGFSALLSGYRYYNGYFWALGALGTTWSSSPAPTDGAFWLQLSGNEATPDVGYTVRSLGNSVRCLKE